MPRDRHVHQHAHPLVKQLDIVMRAKRLPCRTVYEATKVLAIRHWFGAFVSPRLVGFETVANFLGYELKLVPKAGEPQWPGLKRRSAQVIELPSSPTKELSSSDDYT